VYSDLGFIALGAVIEAAAGAPLDLLFDARVAGPLALADTFFLPARDPALAARRRAAHGFAAARRVEGAGQGVLCGEVDDDNARAMGGVAGHAGLFGSARDVARLGQAWLEAVHGRSRWLGADTAARFVARDAATPGSERALGWDTPSRDGSALGARLGRGPRGAVGHLGFTGTSLWLDLDHEVVCALLTNHVHPDGADRARMRAFRASFHDAIAEALGI
jgi:serine-type D-Ala-D-Ala carboxypeptidase